MTEKLKIWTKEDVDRLLQNIDYEAAKKDAHTLNYYRDENDEYDKLEVAVFVVLEWVRDDHEHNIKSSTVRGTQRMGWFWYAFNARKRREEYGDVGDHCLISEDEARETVKAMGLDLDDAKRHLIDSFTKANGYAPVMLPVDPKWETRRDNALKRRGLAPKG